MRFQLGFDAGFTTETSSLDRLRANAPFVQDPNLLASDVVFESPLYTSEGREAYIAANSNWATSLPARLEAWEVRWPQKSPTPVTCSFITVQQHTCTYI